MKIKAVIFFVLLVSCQTNFQNKQSIVSKNSLVTNKPNIILVLLDDVGYEVPTYTGGESYLTPNMDMIAAQGRQYLYCHSLPLCSPSRVELMTGKYNFRNYTRWGVLDTNNITIANILKDAGYNTCVAGKWQLGGGDASIKKFGFNKYCVWQPFTLSEDAGEKIGGSHYKSPVVYQDSGFLNAILMKGKYGEDIFRQYVFDFIDSNKTNPFFIYWALNLCHEPLSPTPDDPEYAAWSGDSSDPRFFPSMVKYMDKELGMLQQKVDSMPNTILIIVADNGTESTVTSQWKGRDVKGSKSKPDETGTRVPMIMYGSGVINGVDSSLIDFSDFLPTIAYLGGATYGFTDGVNFLTTKRNWIFQHYQYDINGLHPLMKNSRWAQTLNFKLYDTVQAVPALPQTGNMYRMFPGALVKKDSLVPKSGANYNTLSNVIKTMHN